MRPIRPSNLGRARKLQHRILAVLLGLSLCTPVIGGWTYSRLLQADWQETCGRCGLVRDVNRRGSSWGRTAAYALPGTPEPAVACSDHVWIESGWGVLDGAWVRLGPVSVKL